MSFVSPAQGRVTSQWGPRERHPVTGKRGFHRGIDIAPPRRGQSGVIVRACYGGTVRTVVSGRPPGDRRPNPVTGTWNTGNCVIIDGPNGGTEYYGHLATIVVAPGDRVVAGTVLGTMGASGNVSGVHLHLEMWDSRWPGGGAKGGNTRDPRRDFKRHGVLPGSAPVLDKAPVVPFPTPEKTPVTPLPERTWLEMVSEPVLRTLLRDEFAKNRAIQNEQQHLAMRRETDAAAQAVIAKLGTISKVSGADIERIRVAILGDRHPKTPNTDFRGAVTSTLLEVKQQGALMEGLVGAVAAQGRGEDFDVDKFLDGVEERQRKVAEEFANDFLGDLSADINLTLTKTKEN